jgi:indolepyruvate ferredoxin oxidoreductase beta subunit
VSPSLPTDVILAGVGGQGSLFASRVIAQAAFHQGVSVRVAETYGVAQRGGAVFSQIRLGYGVSGPLIPRGECRFLLGLEPIEALRRARDYLAPGGSVVLNTRIQLPLETKMAKMAKMAKKGRQPSPDLATIRLELEGLEAGRIVEVDALALAVEAGGPETANVVLLGALSCLPGFPLTGEAMERGIEAAGNKAYLERNLLSLAKGREHGCRLEN